MTNRAVGIDLGASTIHVVVLEAAKGERPAVADARTFEAMDLEGVVAIAAGAHDIAIDAPAALSTAPHRGEESISRKFRTARCGEIALGQQAGIWVPWVTPFDATKVAAWMQVGFDVWGALRGAGHDPIEVYPAGVFRVLAGHVPPRKTTRRRPPRAHRAAGGRRRPPARHRDVVPRRDRRARGRAHRAPEGDREPRVRSDTTAPSCDGSAVWLPAELEASLDPRQGSLIAGAARR